MKKRLGIVVTNNNNVQKKDNIMCYDYICDNHTLVFGIAICVKMQKIGYAIYHSFQKRNGGTTIQYHIIMMIMIMTIALIIKIIRTHMTIMIII